MIWENMSDHEPFNMSSSWSDTLSGHHMEHLVCKSFFSDLFAPFHTSTLSVYIPKLLWHFCETVCYITMEGGWVGKNPLQRIQDLVVGYPYMLKSWKSDKIWPHGRLLKVAYPGCNEIGPTLTAHISGHRHTERSNKSKFSSAGSVLLDPQI